MTLDVSQPARSWLGFDPTQIVEFGIQFHVGDNLNQATRGPVVFQIDSFSLERQTEPDAGSDAEPDASGT